MLIPEEMSQGALKESLKEDEVDWKIHKYNYKLNSVCFQFWFVYNHLTNRKKLICHYRSFEIKFKGKITVYWEL